MTLVEKQEQMIQKINALGDCFDQYSYLIVKARTLPIFPEEYRRDEKLVAGCQSKVWFHGWVENGLFHMVADSDTLIIQGVLAILTDLLDGHPADEVAALEITLLCHTELSVTFTSERSTGIKAILQRIQQTAAQYKRYN